MTDTWSAGKVWRLEECERLTEEEAAKLREEHNKNCTLNEV